MFFDFCGLARKTFVVAVFVCLFNWAYSASAQIMPSPAMTLNSNANTDATVAPFGQDFNSSVAADGAGTVIAVWHADEDLGNIGTDRDIFFSRSTDFGASWENVKFLNSNAATDIESSDGIPDIATDGKGTWVVVWESDDDIQMSGPDFDVFFTRSTDNGVNWSPVAILNSNAFNDNHIDGSTSIATDGQNNWIAVWNSEDDAPEMNSPGFDIFASRSTDNGMSWGDVVVVNSSTGDGHKNADVASDGVDTFVVVWNWPPTGGGGTRSQTRDVFISRSTNKGVSWGDQISLSPSGNDSVTDQNPSVAADAKGNWIATWESEPNFQDSEIFFAHSANNALSWSPGAPLNSNAAADSAFDLAPTIATDDAGNWVTVWYSDEAAGGLDVDHDIFFSHSQNNGSNWSPIQPFNSTATTDLAADRFPVITTNGAGNWVSIWWSTHNLANQAGTDRDIFFSRFFIDITPPLIMVTGNNPETIECGQTYIDAGAMADDDLDGDVTAFIIVDNPVDPTVPGTYTVRYNVEDMAGNVAQEVTRTVNVVDTTPPDISIQGDNPAFVECSATYIEAGARATDNCDGDLGTFMPTNGAVQPFVGTYELTYTVTDTAGNTATAMRTVNVVDTMPPVITVTGATSVTVELGNGYNDEGATWTDNCTVNMAGPFIRTTNPVDPNVAGVYIVRYNINDNAGNDAIEKTRTVTVEDSTRPSVQVEQASGQADPTNELPIEFEVLFSEPVTGFTAADVVFTDNRIGLPIVSSAGDGTSYSIIVTELPSDPGGPLTVQPSIPAGVALDASGNSNLGSTSSDNTVVYDPARPSIAIGESQPTGTCTGTIVFTLTYSGAESVTLNESDVTVNTSPGLTVGSKVVDGTGSTTRTVSLSNFTGEGALSISIAAGTATSATGTSASSAGPSPMAEVQCLSILRVSPTTLNLPAASGTRDIDIFNDGEGDLNWTASPSSVGSWLDASPSIGQNDGTVTVFFTQNDTGLERTGSIFFDAPGSSKSSVTVSVSQSPLGNPVIDLSPSGATFPDTPVNSTTTLTFTITNSGAGTLGGTVSTSPPFSIVGIATYSLLNGESETITVQFAPTIEGFMEGAVNFDGNNAQIPSDDAVLHVSGEGTLQPQITITPIAGDFGLVRVGTTRFVKFRVQNTGGGILSGQASVPPPFSIVSDGVYALAAGAFQDVIVGFTPENEELKGSFMNFSFGTSIIDTISVVGTGESVLGAIRGRVFDFQGALVPCAAISASNGADVFRVVAARRNGSFFFGDLPAGTYTLEVFSPEIPNHVISNISVVDGIDTELNIQLPQTVSGSFISGIVTDMRTDFPLAGIKVEIDENMDGTVDAVTYTCADGLYTAQLSSAKAPTRATFTSSNFDDFFVDVDSSPGINLVDAGLMPNASSFGDLTGVVRELDTNLPVAFAEVEANRGNDTWFVTTEIDGTFDILGLEPAQYEVLISAEGYADHSQLITVFDESVGTVNESFDLTKGNESSIQAFPETITLGSDAAQMSFSVITTVPAGLADVEWTATIAAGGEWLTLDTDNGIGDTTLQATYTQNATGAQRTTTVTITATTAGIIGSPTTVSFTQDAQVIVDPIGGSCGAYPGIPHSQQTMVADLLTAVSFLVAFTFLSVRRRSRRS